jgi:hypothetical protein
LNDKFIKLTRKNLFNKNMFFAYKRESDLIDQK